jgi:uncharacterized protein (DUF427 family)
MSLTMGTGPFARKRAGKFDFSLPEHVVFVEDFPRRVRAVAGGRTVVDSDAVKLVHQTDRLPYYAFPAADVSSDAARPEPAAPGHVRVPWDSADAWYEEDQQVYGHVRDPYHRIDVVPTTRRLRVSVDGVVLAESGQVRGLYETGLPVRWYLPRADVRLDLLERSDTRTRCAYKGQATHWSARVGDRLAEDVAWSYDDDVQREAEDVRGRICFYNEFVDLEIDGKLQERPVTPWSR